MLHLLGHLDVLQHLILRDASQQRQALEQFLQEPGMLPLLVLPGALLPTGTVACAGAAALKQGLQDDPGRVRDWVKAPNPQTLPGER